MPPDRQSLLSQSWQHTCLLLKVWWRQEKRGWRQQRLGRPMLLGAGVALLLVLLAAAEMRWANFERMRLARQRESLAILNASLNALETTTLDWAHWSDLYQWVGGTNPGFVETDLRPSPLFANGGTLLWFTPAKNRGQSFSAWGVNHPRDRTLFGCARSAVVRQPRLNAALALLCRSSDGQLHLGMATAISDSPVKAPIQGTMVMFEPLLKPQAGPLYNQPLQWLVDELRVVPSLRSPSLPGNSSRVGPPPGRGESLGPLGLRWPLFTAGGGNLMLCRDPWWPVLLKGFASDLLVLAALLVAIALARALLLAERRRLLLGQRRQEQSSNRRIRRTGQELDRLLERISRGNPQRGIDDQVLARLIHASSAPSNSPESQASAPVEAKLERLAGQLEYFLQRAKSLALLDPLTQLPNRRYFIEQVQFQVEASQKERNIFAILFVDVDKFKNINDSYGHAAGDSALILVANRLRALIGKKGFLGRYGGDEFAILMPLHPEDPQERRAAESQRLKSINQAGIQANSSADNHGWIRRRLYEEASDIVNEFDSQVMVDDFQFDLTISVGISLVDPEAQDASAALRRADIAMHRAKQNSTARVAVFDPKDEDGYLDSYGLYVDLMQAIRDSHFEIVFQPIVDRQAHIVGVEALSRWNHPRLGEVRPDVFLDLAESYRQINPLSNDLIALTLAAYAPLQQQHPDLRLSLNVPPSKLGDPLFPGELAQLLTNHGLRPAQITVEITERAPLLTESHLGSNLRALKQLGISISLDDFGTGYSSLSLLTLLQPDEVKIDRSFVVAMQGDPLASQVVALMADMVQRMNLRVVAEGVENAGVWEQLLQLHIPCFQGFHFSQPLSAQELGRTTLWRNSTPRPPRTAPFGEDGVASLPTGQP